MNNILIFFYKAIRKTIRQVFGWIQKLNFGNKFNQVIFIYAPGIVAEDKKEIEKRLEFYCPNMREHIVYFNKKPTIEMILSKSPILFFCEDKKQTKWIKEFRPGSFDIDFYRNPMDGWDWCLLSNYVSNYKPDLKKAHREFISWVEKLQQENKQKAYIFGTGPSLERALERDWSDGYTIACNTIVRDPELWNHIQPDIIVAGDAIYHFSNNQYACHFRKDLKKRLKETDTIFIYPSLFYSIVDREFSKFKERTIPIPPGIRKKINYDLKNDFHYPSLGNILNILLLPLACLLSKSVFLWGFDGRAPNDKLFWSNSTKHSYPEDMEELIKSHPAFFQHYVPKNNPYKYVNQVHGDSLEECLTKAERDGWKFTMMHHSWTKPLQNRYHN